MSLTWPYDLKITPKYLAPLRRVKFSKSKIKLFYLWSVISVQSEFNANFYFSEGNDKQTYVLLALNILGVIGCVSIMIFLTLWALGKM